LATLHGKLAMNTVSNDVKGDLIKSFRTIGSVLVLVTPNEASGNTRGHIDWKVLQANSSLSDWTIVTRE